MKSIVKNIIINNYSVFVIAVVVSIISCVASTKEIVPFKKQKLTIAIILPQNYLFELRRFKTCINDEARQIHNGNWSFLSYFSLESYTIIIQKRYNDILETLCSLLTTQSSTAIYINYKDYLNIEASNSKLFLKFANYINMPVMAFVPNAYPTNNPRHNEIQLAPTLYHQCEAIMALMSRYEWQKYSIITTDFFGSEEFLQAAEILKDADKDKKKHFEILSIIKLSIRKAKTNKSEVFKRLRSMNLETRVILLHCSIDETQMIFQVANELGLTTHEYMWILTRSVIEKQDQTGFQYTHFPTGSFALSFDTAANDICQNVVVDAIRLWASALEKYSKANKENINTIIPHTKCWNQSSDENSQNMNIKYHYGKNFHKYLMQASTTTKSQDRTIKFNERGVIDNVEFKILNLDNKYQFRPVGVWVNKTIVMDDILWPGNSHKPPSDRPMKFHLKIVTLEERPFVIYKEPPPDGNCPPNSVSVRLANNANITLNASNPKHYACASGFYIDLLIILQDRLEFTFEIYEVEDKNWGARVRNSWNGIIRDIMTGKADVAMTSLKITEERSQAIDFSIPFMETGIAIVVALRPGAISTTAFLKPYDYLIWIMILLVILHSVSISVYLFEWIKNKLLYSKTKKHKRLYRFRFISNPDTISTIRRQSSLLKSYSLDKIAKIFTLQKIRAGQPKFTFGRSLWMIWVLLFRAATEVVQPTGFTSRVMSNIWACFCLAFMASYTANLAAFMITKPEFYDLHGIEDDRLLNPMMHNPSLRFGTIKHGSTEEIIRKNYPTMYKYMEKYMQTHVSAGINAVIENKIDAFIYDAVVLDYRSGINCTLRVVGKWFAMTGYGIGLPKGSKYKEMIDRKILEYSHSGELERSQRFWFSGVCKTKFENSKRGSHPLDELNFTSAFLLLGTGIVISLLFLILDHMYTRIFKKKLQGIWIYKPSGNSSLIQESSSSLLDTTDSYKRSDSTDISDEQFLSNDCHNCNNSTCKYQISILENSLNVMTKMYNELQLALPRNNSLQIRSHEDCDSSLSNLDEPLAILSDNSQQIHSCYLKTNNNDSAYTNSLTKSILKTSLYKKQSIDSNLHDDNNIDPHKVKLLPQISGDELSSFYKKRLECETVL